MFQSKIGSNSEPSRRAAWTVSAALAAQSLGVLAILLSSFVRVPVLDYPHRLTPLAKPLEEITPEPKAKTPPPLVVVSRERFLDLTVARPAATYVNRAPSALPEPPSASPLVQGDFGMRDPFAAVGGTGLGELKANAVGAGSWSTPPAAPAKPSAPVRLVSELGAVRLLEAPKPVYPPIARASRIEGTVRLRALIDREGKVADLQLLSGPPLLISAARAAVVQWRYKPLLLNGVSVEFITVIDVNFTLR